MAGKRKKSTPPPTPKKSGEFPWWAVRLGLIILAVSAGGGGMFLLRKELLNRPQYAGVKAKVALASVPNWMPGEIARGVREGIQRAAEGRSVFEQDLAQDVHDAALANAWIAKVGRVTKSSSGQVKVEAEFRQPYAMVIPNSGRSVIVDREAVVLPLSPRAYAGRYIPVVRGVMGQAPVVGKQWGDADILDGVRLLKLMQDRPFRREVTAIDVRNHRGRVDPRASHLLIIAQLARGSRTTIQFGRFPDEGIPDYCVSPAQKMLYLDTYVRGNGGRLSGTHRKVDLRYDKPYASLQ